MYMGDWIGKLDDFLKLSDREVLGHAGKVSHESAAAKAELEYERFSIARAEEPTPVDRHFEGAVREVKLLENVRPATTAKRAPGAKKKR